MRNNLERRVHAPYPRIAALMLPLALVGCDGGSDDGGVVDRCSAYVDYAGAWQCMGGAEPLATCNMTVAYNELAEDCALRCLFTPCMARSILDSTTDANGRVTSFTCDNGFPTAPIECSRVSAP